MADKPALLEHLSTKAIYDTTMNIPFPYSGADADWWLTKRIEHTRRQRKEVTFAIRDEGNLIGVVSADSFEPGTTHRAEIGYWLAQGYWGQGVMTDAVRAFVRYAFAELEVLRLTAHVLASNVASARVLEKNGFTAEGYLRKHFLKDGQLIDARYYGVLKDELA
ncbi:MAG: acetyltransferase [Acidobacteria bacterium]|nr:acetyltransferase [Acidobacteriota bacterium]